MLNYVIRHEHDSSEMAIRFRTTNVLLGKFWPTTDAIDEPIMIVGNKLVPATLKHGWNRFSTVQRLGLPWPNLSTGFEPLEQPAMLTDSRNRIRRLTELRDNVSFSGPAAPTDIAEFGQWYKTIADKVVADPATGREFLARVERLGSHHEALAGIFDPSSETELLVAELDPIIQIAVALPEDVSTGTLIDAIDRELAETYSTLEADGGNLKDDLQPYVEAMASLALFGQNGGHRAPTFILNCRDVNDVIASHRPQLIKLLSSLPKAPHIDLGIMNRVTRGPACLTKLGSELDKHPQRTCVWATVGYVNESQALKIAEGNPTVANEGCGTVFPFFGKPTHRGYTAVASAAVHGWRVAHDECYNDSESGPMTHHWGPQSFKHLDGIDDLDTFGWDLETLRFMAENAGINAITKHSNGVVSPFSGRTLSSLANYRFVDSSRLATMLTGFVMAYLDVEAPARENVPEVQRSLCDRAHEMFFSPFEGRNGFKGALTPMPSMSAGKTEFKLAITVSSAPPISEVIVVRRHEK